MNWWFIALVVLCGMRLGVNVALHGELPKNKHNGPVALVVYGIYLSLIYMAIRHGFAN